MLAVKEKLRIVLVLRELVVFIYSVVLLFLVFIWFIPFDCLACKLKGTKSEKFLFKIEEKLELAIEKIIFKCEKFIDWLFD